jgi:hypothetical protein
VRLEDVLNGAGPLVVISALPMLVGLLARGGALAPPLRRAAISLALALPFLFMAGAAVLYSRQPGATPFDFGVNYQAASALYGRGENPYSVHAAYSFPFPTFYLYWLASLLGSLSQSQTWIAWWLVNGLVWLGGALLLWRTLPRPASPGERDTLLYAAVAVPATTVLWQGQTALWILLGLVALHAAAARPGNRWLVIGGIGLAWAILIKPQMALIGLGIAVWALLRRGAEARRAAWLLAVGVVAALALIALTILLPGGVTLDTYSRFVTEALPQVARPADRLVIGSPAFAAGAVALDLGASESAADLIANGVTVLVVALAAVWTARRAGRPLGEMAAGWGVWAMVAPRVAWMWYAVWCLPFFLLAIQEALRQPRPRSGWRLALIVIALALVNLQISSLALALGTVLLLIGLLWTSFQPDSEHTTALVRQSDSL